jgi:hypothetical protein
MFLLCLQPSSPPPPQQFVVQHSLFGTPVTKTKDPPRYEEAIKQTRSVQSGLPEVRADSAWFLRLVFQVSSSHFDQTCTECLV